MAKVIKYKSLSCEINHGTEENPDIEKIFIDVEIRCSTQAQYDVNYPIAEKEAYNGEIVVEGEFDTETYDEPTLETRVETLETDSAEMREALDMILSGVTE